MDDASALAPGKQLGKYRLEGLLGRGGMGEVWAAHDPDLDRKVALKVLRATASTEDARLRLLREGRAMARLRHPNVITVYEATAADGRDVIAMELIDGQSLAGWLAEQRTPDAIVATLLAAGRGLAAAHAAGMIHRDFKPHNVLVDRDGRVVVTDFGLARGIGDDGGANAGVSASASERSPVPPALTATLTATPPQAADLGSADTLAPVDATVSSAPRPVVDSARVTDRAALHSPLTRTGALIGTPAYMAPEQLAGETADARSDQYAFCVTAWEALAGTRPFVGTTFAELRDAVDAGTPVGADKVPPRLRPLLARGLAPDPADRWPTMDALLGAIDRAWRRPRRIKIAAAVAIGAVAVAAVPIAMWLRAGTGATGPCPPVDQAFGPQNVALMRDSAAKVAATGAAGARLGPFFDRWHRSWSATYQQVCAEPRHPDFLARRACLDSARDEVLREARLATHATAAVLGETDPGAQVVQPDGCLAHPRAVAPPLPADPAKAAEVERIGNELLAYRGHPPLKPDDLAALDRLVAAATATGHEPIIAEALVVKGNRLLGFDAAQACDAFTAGFAHAERAGADVIAIDSLLGQIDCSEDVPARRGDIGGLIDRAASSIERIDAASRRAYLDSMHAHLLATRFQFDAALALAEKSRAEWTALDAPIEALRATVKEAEILLQRGHPEDLHQAEVMIRDALGRAPANADGPIARGYRRLGDVLWAMGRLDEAVAILSRRGLPAPAGDIDVVVHVAMIDGTPAEGADVEAAIDPIGDPIRLVRTEWKPTVQARTDATGTVTLRVPRGALVLARKSSQLGGGMPPDAGGELSIRLQPTAYIVGTVTETGGPAPADARAARRMGVTVTATVWIDHHRWSLASPVARDGRFHLSMLPGHALVAVEGQTELDDFFATQTPIELVAGSQPVALAIPPPVSLRVIVRPGIEGVVVAVAGAHAIKRWADLDKLLTASPGAMALAASREPATRPSDDVLVGDMVIALGAPGPGAMTVCALPGASSGAFTPLPILTPGPDATPPRCVVATAVDGATTTVVVPTAK